MGGAFGASTFAPHCTLPLKVALHRSPGLLCAHSLYSCCPRGASAPDHRATPPTAPSVPQLICEILSTFQRPFSSCHITLLQLQITTKKSMVLNISPGLPAFCTGLSSLLFFPLSSLFSSITSPPPLSHSPFPGFSNALTVYTVTS